MENGKCKSIAAGMVLYNPENITRVQECINSIIPYVDKIYIFNNSTKKLALSLQNGCIICKTKNQNMGIAYALNQIMDMAKNDGYEWVITMDQDSILPKGIILDFEQQIHSDDQIAIICPQVIDRRRAYMQAEQKADTEYIDMCITSASCTSVHAWEQVGKFDEWLFIDLVDNEFCKRLIVSGYKILRLNKWVLDQEYGKITPKSPVQQKFWIKASKIFHNENIAKFSYQKFVNPMRVYYTCRNIIYVNKKLKKYGPIAYENYNCKGYIGFWICFSLPSILRADRKGKVLGSVVNGTIDGLKKKVEPWKP